MANEHINKVTYFGTDLIDLTTDTIVPGDVLATKIVHLPSGEQTTGTMANNGSGTATISTKDGSVTIQTGYYSGGGTVSIDPDEKLKLIARNIRSGVTILGVAGSMSGAEDTYAQTRTVDPSNTQQTVQADGYMTLVDKPNDWQTDGVYYKKVNEQYELVTASDKWETDDPNYHGPYYARYTCLSQVIVNAVPYDDSQITAGGKTVYIGTIPSSVSS